MQANQLFRYAAIALLFAGAPLYLARHVVPAFAWLSPVCAMAGCFSLMAAKQGPRKAVSRFGKQTLLFAGIWVLICVGLVIYWMR